MSILPAISIILPIYGVEQYIQKCITSIMQQTFQQFEVLVVDDGSKDQSIQMAKAVVGDDARFIFLEKENGGQGSARNMGLDHARAEYIAFIDGDDYIEPTYLEKLYEQILITDADICTCDVNVVMHEQVLRVIHNDIQAYIDKDDFLLCLDTVTSFMCDKLFKASVFTNMRFDPHIRTYEDSHLVFRLIYGKTMTRVNLPLYNYVQRLGSTTNSINPTYIEDKTAVMDTFLVFAKEVHKYTERWDYITFCYLKTYVYITTVGLARYSQNYRKDICSFYQQLDDSFWNTKNIQQIAKQDKKVGLGLKVLKFSKQLFRAIIKLRDVMVKNV